MRTRYEQMTAGGIDGYSNFMGDDTGYREWLGVIGRHRDSDALERSNFRVALEMLGGESDEVRVERCGHWAVGWIEEAYVRPGSKAAKIAEEIEAALANYPVLSDEDFSAEEHDEAGQVWWNCYRWPERVKYIRENRRQFEFHDWQDMLACVRGEHFAGWACELLS